MCDQRSESTPPATSTPERAKPSRRHRKLGLLVLPLLSALLLAACGSSSSSSSSTSSSSGSSASSGSSTSGTSSSATGSPVKLGFFVNLTGTDTQYPDGLAGAEAAVRGINARGGINGHQAQLDYCDVQSSVNVAEECARKFVSDHVAAVVGNNTNYGPQQTAVLTSANIPDIADLGITAASQYASPIEFPISSGFVGNFAAGTYYGLKLANLNSFGFVGVQLPVVAALEAGVQSTVKKQGGVWNGFIAMPASTTSFAPYAAAAASKKADIVYLAISGQQSAEFALASEAGGYTFHAYSVAIAFTPATIATLGPNTAFGKAMLFGADIPPPSASAQFPVLKQFQSDMTAEAQSGDKYAGPQYRSVAQEEVWYGFHAAYQVMSLIKGPITAASTLHELLTAKDVDLGLQPPWTPSAPGPKGFGRVNNWNEYMMKLVNGKFALAYPTSYSVESFVVG
jgi:ABC-type branched-subunit amino acid transport system substrate-binding protein